MAMNGFDDLPTAADGMVTPTYWGRYAYVSCRDVE
jgi:hypothetical protein